jgi:hypothetical protein
MKGHWLTAGISIKIYHDAKRQDMKRMLRHRKRAILALLAVLALAGCDQIPFLAKFQQPQQQQFHPLDNEVAMMAAPQPPKEAPQLTCRIGKGNAHFSKGWYEYVDASFALSPNSRITVPVARAKGDEKIDIVGIFDADGQKLIFCPKVDGPPGKRIACFSLYVLDDDLNMGIKRTFDVPAAIRGAEITCAYETSKLQKL